MQKGRNSTTINKFGPFGGQVYLGKFLSFIRNPRRERFWFRSGNSTAKRTQTPWFPYISECMYLYIEFLIKVNPCPPSMSYIYIYTSIYETGILARQLWIFLTFYISIRSKNASWVLTLLVINVDFFHSFYLYSVIRDERFWPWHWIYCVCVFFAERNLRQGKMWKYLNIFTTYYCVRTELKDWTLKKIFKK